MAKWDEIRSSVSRAASSTVKKSEEIANTATMHVKLARLMSQRDEQFEKLGKLTYRQLKTDESFAEEIAAVISQIDTLGSQIIKQKAKIETEKARKAAEKARKAEEKEACEKAQSSAEQVSEQVCVENIKEMLDASISD